MPGIRTSTDVEEKATPIHEMHAAGRKDHLGDTAPNCWANLLIYVFLIVWMTVGQWHSWCSMHQSKMKCPAAAASGRFAPIAVTSETDAELDLRLRWERSNSVLWIKIGQDDESLLSVIGEQLLACGFLCLTGQQISQQQPAQSVEILLELLA